MAVKRDSVNLTQGPILNQIILFAIPLLLGQLFQQLYNSVDSIVVGRFVGTTALAAVSSSGDISMLLTGFFVGFSSGASVVFGRAFGANRLDKLHDAIHTALLFSVLIGVGIALLGIICTPLLLRLVNCPDDVWIESDRYLRVYLIGVLFTSVYNVGAGVLRAVGDSRNPLIFLIISSVTNIILDLCFVALLGWGVMGVAIATVISQLTSVVLVIRKMLVTEDVYKLVPSDLRIKRALLGEILSMGLPAAVQASLLSVSNMIVQRNINGFGSTVMAGAGVGKRIDRFCGLVPHCVGMALSVFASQNIGAQKYARVYRSVRTCALICTVFTVLIWIPTFLFTHEVSAIFTKDEDAIAVAVRMVRVMMPFYLFQGFYQVYSGVLRSFGRSRAVMILSLVGMIGFRQLYLSIALALDHRIEHVFLCFPVGWIAAAVLMIVDYWLKVKRVYPAVDLPQEEYEE